MFCYWFLVDILQASFKQSVSLSSSPLLQRPELSASCCNKHSGGALSASSILPYTTHNTYGNPEHLKISHKLFSSHNDLPSETYLFPQFFQNSYTPEESLSSIFSLFLTSSIHLITRNNFLFHPYFETFQSSVSDALCSLS